MDYANTTRSHIHKNEVEIINNVMDGNSGNKKKEISSM